MSSMRSLVKFIVPAVAFGLGAAVVVTAGPLDPPPGAIAPTYKTLSEIEPRIAITSANTPGDATAVHRITQSGSYYLTGNVSGVANRHTIMILANNVTIDLNGFSLLGVTNSLDGIRTTGTYSNLRIRNGSVIAHGQIGVNLVASSDCGLEQVQIMNCGLSGAALGTRSMVKSVHVTNNADIGLAIGESSVVDNSTAVANKIGFRVTGATVRLQNCSARSNSGIGFELFSECDLSNCVATMNAGHGFSAAGGRISLSDCKADANANNGFYIAGYDAVFSRCVARVNGTNGTASGFFSATGGNHSFVDCTSYFNAVHGFESVVIRTDYRDCVSLENGGDGFRSTNYPVRIHGARIESNGTRGIEAGAGSFIERAMIRMSGTDGIRIGGNGNATIRECHVQNTGGIGAILGNGSVIEKCLFSANGNNGVTAGSLTVIRDCTFDNNGTSAGTTGHIYCTGNGNLIEGNYIYNGDPGIVVTTGGGTIVRRNIVNGTANNYGLIVGGNRVATINTSATLSSTNPNDNFSY